MRSSGRLINREGDARFGVFDEPVAEVNFREYDLRTPMDRRRGPLARHFAFNQFQFLGGMSEGLLFGCAIVNIRYVGQAFLYFYEPLGRRLCEYSFRAPLAVGTHFDQRPEDGTATFRSGGNHFAMTATAEPRQRQLWVKLENGVEVDALFDEQTPRLQPMWISTPAGANGFVFARKTAGARVTGKVRREGKTLDLGELGVFGHNDWTAGYMRRETFWNWGCFAGAIGDGCVVGLNVSCGVNETGHTENCFWVDGGLHRVGCVSFDYDRRDLMKTWRVRDSDGRVDLEFTPEGSHAEKVNALVVATNFRQLFGRYNGTLATRGGDVLRIHGQLGYAERHYAKW